MGNFSGIFLQNIPLLIKNKLKNKSLLGAFIKFFVNKIFRYMLIQASFQ